MTAVNSEDSKKKKEEVEIQQKKQNESESESKDSQVDSKSIDKSVDIPLENKPEISDNKIKQKDETKPIPENQEDKEETVITTPPEVTKNEKTSLIEKTDQTSETKESEDKNKQNSETNEEIIQKNTEESIEEANNKTNETEEETNHDIDLVIDSEKPENEEKKKEKEEEQVTFKATESNSLQKVMQLLSFGFFGSIAVCLLLSCYYRLHLLKNKRAPFNAPKGLKPLFPTPVNYEYEITQLCDKYLAQ